MPVSSLQAGIIGLATSVISLLVGLAVLSPHSGGTIVAFVGGFTGFAFMIANSVIHHGVSRASGTDATRQ